MFQLGLGPSFTSAAADAATKWLHRYHQLIGRSPMTASQFRFTRQSDGGTHLASRTIGLNMTGCCGQISGRKARRTPSSSMRLGSGISTSGQARIIRPKKVGKQTWPKTRPKEIGLDGSALCANPGGAGLNTRMVWAQSSFGATAVCSHLLH
jgi:hypothetical protein